MFVTTIARYITWLFSIVVTGVFVFSYSMSENRIDSIKSMYWLTVVTVVTEICAPVLALLLFYCVGGCKKEGLNAADPRFNVALTIPGIKNADAQHEMYRNWLLENYEEDHKLYFAQEQ